MNTSPDLIKIGDFNLESYQSFLQKLENFNWNRSSLDRRDGLSESGISKVIFFDHFESIKDHTSMYSYEIDKDAQHLKESTFSLLDGLISLFPNYIYVKGEISCCCPNSFQKYHVDPRIFHRYCRRIHLPIIVNDQCFLSIGTDDYHLEKQTLYEFNNIKLHRSKNLGSTNRVHIIVDIIEQEIFNKCKKIFGEGFYSKVAPDWKMLDL